MIHHQEQRPLNLPGPPPPESPFAYEPREDLEDWKVDAVESLSITNDTSATIESHLEKSSDTSFDAKLASTSVLGPVPLHVEIIGKDDVPIRLTGLFFTISKNETGDMTFSNEGQDVPLHMTVIAHAMTGKMSIGLSLKYTGLNVQQALGWAKFVRSLAEGGEFRLIVQTDKIATNVNALWGKIPTGIHAGPDSHTIKLFELLVFIQTRTGIDLFVPEDGISPEDAQNIRVAARILETGLVTYRTPSWEIAIGLEQAKGLLNTYSERKSIPIVMEDPTGQAINVLGVNVDLGPKLVGVKQTYITDEDLEKLRQAVEASTTGSVINATVSPYRDCPAEEHYMRWLPVEHAAAIFRMIIFKDEKPEQFLTKLLQATYQGKNTSPSRFAELLAALRKNVAPHEASTSNPLVTASTEELISALCIVMKNAPQVARIDMSILLFQHEVLSIDDATRFAGIEKDALLSRSRSLDIAIHNLNEGELALPSVDVEQAVALLKSWCVEDPQEQQEQQETWEYLKTALDEDRLSDRKLFA